MVTNYAEDIKDLLSTNWTATNMESNFTPTFDCDTKIACWGAMRRILVHEVESAHRPEDCSNAVQEVTRTYQIELFSLDVSEVQDMREEVQRILDLKFLDPFTGMTVLLPDRWVDLTGTMGEYYRLVLTVIGTSFVNV